MAVLSPVTIINNQDVTLFYHPDTKIVHHQFHKFVHGQPFRDALTQGVLAMKKNGAKKWLSDDRSNSALNEEDSDWAKSQWFPQVLQAGWKHWAVVMPEKIVGQLNMKRWIAMYAEAGVTAKMFTNPDEAMKWLASQ